MIIYKCKKCNLTMETELCTSCGKKIVSESEIYWCNNCNIPIFDKVCSLCSTKGAYIGTDLRPVFPKEKLLLGIVLDNKNPLFYRTSH